ncbi:MAG: PhnD/SsuA/transferrin family substrate-binding protein [Oscillospiraceae bacterium]|nr:PhnD/SsuA/transferrin family substrate-binding protein [Oscillospiraceae bacterium]
MKKIVALLLALVMVLALAACGSSSAPAAPAAASDETGKPHFDKLTLEFVPSKDADVIIAGTANLPELVKAEMANLGYDIDEVDITVGTSYAATGEAMSAGSIDVGWLPAGTYILYSDDVDVILTATRNGLSNDSENPADWNGEANKTLKNGPQVTYYRALIYATPSAYGQELAAKVNAGEALTWDDLNAASWAVLNNSSNAGYIYPTMWLMKNYDGKKLTDLDKVTTLEGYGPAFSYAAAESVDIIVCYADGRNDYEASWTIPENEVDETGKQGLGRPDSIWNELNVIGVTDGVYNDTVSISKSSPYYTPELVDALQQCFINIAATDEGKAIFDIYSHTGYVVATDADYDNSRLAMELMEG